MKMNIEPAFTLLDLHQRLLPCREAYWSTNTKGVIQCLKFARLPPYVSVFAMSLPVKG